MPRTKTRSPKRRKPHPNAKIKRKPKRKISASAHNKKQKRAAVELVEMMESLMKIAPSAEHILRKVATQSFPLIQPFDLQSYTSRVRAWVPGKGTAAQVPAQFSDFIEYNESQASASTLSSWESARRILAANGQGIAGKNKAVMYFGYLIVFDEDIAYPVPHCWIALEEQAKNPKRVLIDVCLPEGLTSHILDLLSREYESTPDFQKEFEGFSLLNHGYVAGKCPHGLMYVGSPADPEAAEATILWWTQAVMDDQKGKGATIEPPPSYSMSGILQFIRNLSDNAVEDDDDGEEGEDVPEEPEGDVPGEPDGEHGRGDDAAVEEASAVGDEGDHRVDGA